MQWPPNRYFAYAIIMILVGSVFSIALPDFQPSYASHENITMNIGIDDVTDTYDQGDSVVIEGVIDEVVENEDVVVRIGVPGDSTPNQVQSDEPGSSGNFDYLYQVPNSGEDGVYTVEVEYDDETAYTYFIVDEDDDTILVVLDEETAIYAAGSEVEIAGAVDELESGEEDVAIIVFDPANVEIVDELVELDGDEFTFTFDLENDASHGRYAVLVTYGDATELEGSILFEIEDEGPAEEEEEDTVSEGDSDTDGDLSAEIELATYAPGESVVVTGTIEDYDDTEVVAISVEDADGEEFEAEDDLNVDDVGTDGEFEFDFDLETFAIEGDYTVIITYANDEVKLTFEVEGEPDSSDSGDLTVRLNKASYLAGETMTVSGTVAEVEENDDGEPEEVSIFIYRPGGQVILESGSSKYVAPSSSGAYSATIVLPSDLDVDDDYYVKVSYVGVDDVEVLFDITGVSDTPSDEITVETDDNEYNIGQTVEISGEVPDAMIVDGQQLLIRVNTPDGNPCRLDPIDVPSSGSFSYDLVLGGKCGVAGEYEIEVTYNGQEGSTTFELIGSSASQYNLSVEGDNYPIEYELTGGSINRMFVGPNKLVVTLNAEDDGQLTLVLPREVIDAVEDGEDISYVVTVEDESGNISTMDVEETDNTDDARTIVIDYEAGTERIEIIGTQVVPEFGTIAAIIMAVAILGIIMVTARYNKFSLFRQ